MLPARGLHWVSRLHLLTGIGSYLTAPLWLMFLLLGILISLQAQFVRPEYFPKGFSLFPQWPAQDPILAAWVFVGTMGLLIVPEAAGLHPAADADARTPAVRRRPCAFSPGMIVETLLSGLIAPVMMIFQSSAVGEILLGRDAGWQVQRRDDGGRAAARDGAKIRRADACSGSRWRSVAYAVSLPLLLWMMPVIAGLLLAVPIAMLSSSAADPNAGCSARLRRRPPPVLARANELAKRIARRSAARCRNSCDDPALLRRI